MRRARAVLVVALAALGLLVAVSPAPARAAEVTFGPPEATATYGESIEFSVPFTAASPVRRVELRLLYEGATGPFIAPVAVEPGAGSQTLRYAIDLAQGGHLYPGTEIRATWVAVLSDGSTVTSRESEVAYADTSRDWRTIKGDIVNVHWYEGDRAFGERALEIAERAIRETSETLGSPQTERVDFFIYGDDAAFGVAMGPGTRENVVGSYIPGTRRMFALIPPDSIFDPWIQVNVPHELVHLVMDSAVANPYRYPPRWVNEGVATYLSEGYTEEDRLRVEAGIRSGDLLPLGAISWEVPTDSKKGLLAYAESVSAIDHLVRTYGRDSLVALVRAYRDGITDDEAFTRAIGRDLAAFQQAWLAELGAEVPRPFGPQPGAAGPLPESWVTPGETPAGSPATPQEGPATAVPATPPAAQPGAPPPDETRALTVLAIAVLAMAGASVLMVLRRRGRAA